MHGTTKRLRYDQQKLGVNFGRIIGCQTKSILELPSDVLRGITREELANGSLHANKRRKREENKEGERREKWLK